MSIELEIFTAPVMNGDLKLTKHSEIKNSQEDNYEFKEQN